MMTETEVKALKDLLEYIEKDGWWYLNSGELTDTLNNYINGLYSTGNIK